MQVLIGKMQVLLGVPLSDGGEPLPEDLLFH
jgi:hypothetical protein